jgi:cytochrome c biogenesis protein CcmG/thiol:disulfide interchange protein DsbE
VSARPGAAGRNVRGPAASLGLGILLIALGTLVGLAAGWRLWLAAVEPTAAAPGPRPTPWAKVGPFAGEGAPDFELPRLGGGTDRLSAHQAQKHRVLLNFFASWCDACRKEMPGVQAQAEKHAEHGWVVLAVDVMEGAGAAQAFRDELGLTFPILLDEAGEVTRQYLVQGTPTNLVIDRDGMVVDRRLGYMSEAEIEAMLASVP